MTLQEAERALSEETSTPNQDDSSSDLEISLSLESLQDDSLKSRIDPCTNQTLYKTSLIQLSGLKLIR